ncbi:Putative inner membrane protein YjeT (clustered with HflC) [gamma proteobacterium IMCC1989]|jgi:uncharacterized protein YjeT (DUF2065 family)|nr:Putative inner membrane protein YjeT (clustered with HflC) [gamma proteobacterium IMCC1989]
MWEALLQAFCLLLIIEGVIPFLYPSKWRRLVAQLALITDHQLRVMGLFSMLLGLSILYLLT